MNAQAGANITDPVAYYNNMVQAYHDAYGPEAAAAMAAYYAPYFAQFGIPQPQEGAGGGVEEKNSAVENALHRQSSLGYKRDENVTDDRAHRHDRERRDRRDHDRTDRRRSASPRRRR